MAPNRWMHRRSGVQFELTGLAGLSGNPTLSTMRPQGVKPNEVLPRNRRAMTRLSKARTAGECCAITAAMDLFVVPTIGFNLLYVLVVVRLARRELVSINVTAHPTSEWIAHMLPGPRSGRHLRCCGHPPITSHGHPRQAHCPELALAEYVRGETDRHDPTGMSRPHDRVRGDAPLSDPSEVYCLL